MIRVHVKGLFVSDESKCPCCSKPVGIAMGSFSKKMEGAGIYLPDETIMKVRTIVREAINAYGIFKCRNCYSSTQSRAAFVVDVNGDLRNPVCPDCILKILKEMDGESNIERPIYIQKLTGSWVKRLLGDGTSIILPSVEQVALPSEDPDDNDDDEGDDDDDDDTPKNEDGGVLF